jgi:hypothetical protein
MFETRHRLKRVPTSSRSLLRTIAVVLTVSIFGLAAPSPAAVSTKVEAPASVQVLVATHVHESAMAQRARRLQRAHQASRARPVLARTELLAFTSAPTATQAHVVALIHSDFPASAWHDAEIVAWCESKFRPTDIGFDSNGTHDRGVFQLNDGGTEQYLLTMLGHSPSDLALAFNPVVNVRLAALLYSRDGWSPWSCASQIPA